jgi:cell division transport system permease protein
VRRFDYYFRETGQGLKRNGLVAFAAVSTSFVALFLLGIALLVRSEVNLIIKAAEADVEVTVFLSDNISPAQQQQLSTLISSIPEVKTVEFESKEDAYRHFQEIFKDQPDLVQNVTPEALPSSFRVTLKDPEQFRVVAAQLADQPGIDNIRDNRQFYSRLFEVTAVFRVGMFAVAIVMLISAAVLIGNTVRLAVFNRRKEIGIMRLVGATNWHIRTPFVIEGIIEGLLGAGAAILALFIMKVAFIDPLRGKIQFLPWIDTPDVVAAIPWLLFLSIVVSFLASLIAMRRFLEV